MNVISPIWRKCEDTKRYTIMNCTKGGSESKQENSRAEQGSGKKRLQMVHRWSTLQLRHSDRQWRSQHDLRFRIWTWRSRGVRKLPNEYVRWSQMACTSKHTRTWSSDVIQQVHVLTSKLKRKIRSWYKIQKSSNYMCINKSEQRKHVLKTELKA